MNKFEKMKLLGQQLGYAPLNSYLCAEYVLDNPQEEKEKEKKQHHNQHHQEEEEATEEHAPEELCDYSLVVESDYAIVLNVKKYEVQHKFPNEVKNILTEKKTTQLEWIK